MWDVVAQTCLGCCCGALFMVCTAPGPSEEPKEPPRPIVQKC